jgi:ornithine carbamoyltransferase
MPVNLKNRHFLKLLDYTPQEIKFLLELSESLKKAKYAGHRAAFAKREKHCSDIRKIFDPNTMCF